MKSLLSLATVLLFSFSAFATDMDNVTLEMSSEEASLLASQNLSYNYQTTKVHKPVYAKFTLTNNGKIPIMIHKIAVVGVDFAGFYACPSVMPAFAKCSVVTVFDPWSAGLKTGEIYIFGLDGVMTIHLSGLAVK